MWPLAATALFAGLIVWMSRDLTRASARPVLTGGLVGSDVGFVVTLSATLDRTMNGVGWSGVLIYLVFGVEFAYHRFAGAAK